MTGDHETAESEWICHVCGERHEGLPLSWGFDEPLYWAWLTDGERAEGECGTDLCWFTDEDGGLARFVRGTIEIPILDAVVTSEETFVIGVWVTLSETNFNLYLDDPDASAEQQGDPWFGWLSNRIDLHCDDTLNLKTNVHLRGGGLRPSIEVQPSAHPLSLDQHEGITARRAHELAERWLHT